MNRNELAVYRNRFTRYLVTLLVIVLMVSGTVSVIRNIREWLSPKQTTAVQPISDDRPVITMPEITTTNVTNTTVSKKADKKVDDSAVIGGTLYSSVFRQGGYNKGADGQNYIYSLEMNTAHIDLNVNNGYKYLKGRLVLSDYSKTRTYLRAQIMIYDVGCSQPFYVSSEMTEDDRSDIEILVDLTGHEKIRIEIPYFRDLYLATDGLYFSDSK